MAETAPKIYHITHIGNLPGIIENGLWSDAECIRQGLKCSSVGMSKLKERRLTELAVRCHAGTKVGSYVPFYFCPRSIMLFLLARGNHPDLTYDGGQRRIVHLVADSSKAAQWAAVAGHRWAFTNGNASARYTRFSNEFAKIRELDWQAIQQTDWRDPLIKEAKQAEFLVERHFPWTLVEQIGVIDGTMETETRHILQSATHQPDVNVVREWYY
jgi:hypothetical protein